MKTLFFCLLIGTAVLLQGCAEFISPDVSDLQLTLLSPPDSLFTSREALDFRWQQEDAVEKHHFQLFVAENTLPYLLVDTVMDVARLRLQLPEGSYRWQLRAVNASSTSAFQQHSLFVDRSPPMAAQARYPLPGDSLSLVGDVLALRWQSGDAIGNGPLMAVRDSVYLYQWSNGWPFLLQAFELDETEEKVIFLKEALGESHKLHAGAYRWEVKSFDRLGQATCSSLFNFFLK